MIWLSLNTLNIEFISPTHVNAAPLSRTAQRGQALMKKHQCNRCHLVSGAKGLKPISEPLHCVSCHVNILKTTYDPEVIKIKLQTYPDWQRYLNSIKHFTQLPDLGTLTRRVDAKFIERFLAHPFDLRPHLEESMYAPTLSKQERTQVAQYLKELNGKTAAPLVKPPPPITEEQLNKGKQLFISFGCPTCHVLANQQFGHQYQKALYQAMKTVAPLAPNLRFVRERIPRETLIKFIMNPKLIDPNSPMPALGVNQAEAILIADFLISTPLETKPPKPYQEPVIPLLKRQVDFKEVDRKVFARICVHCHMDPKLSDGQGGPGNSGGFGFKGAGLSLQTYQGVKQGIKRHGRRISILKGDQPEDTLLMRALLRRHQETQRDFRTPFDDQSPLSQVKREKVPGMPLSLPPLSLEELSLIKTWITQGALGP